MEKKPVPKLPIKILVIILSEGFFFSLFLWIVLILPDFSSVSATAMQFVWRVLIAFGFSLIPGISCYYAFIIMIQRRLTFLGFVIVGVSAIAFLGSVPLFTWLLAGGEWGGITLGMFAGANGIACAVPLLLMQLTFIGPEFSLMSPI